MRQFVCPSCGAGNRIPEDRDPALARCGRCKAEVLSGEPLEVNAEAFGRQLAGTKGVPVLVDFWAPWCGPCRAMAPQFAAAAQRVGASARFLKLNADESPGPCAQYAVQSLPSLLLFLDGRLIARKAGLMSADQIVDWVSLAAAKAAV
ncbi:thioredoxin domain-containing protein [Caulobacter sp. SL161]|uniref:thioredoxin domain-containing protein n=1 Tax=Caulobacter sp. SL161 TaxID=2995156 RepID=UPI00227459A4|nr:thioredoxin domain-containing protein [Caulobacter sp. SL161]MCY1648334.1 thioredoxin domain-containing protein [Caulobacter sp. SL161]